MIIGAVAGGILMALMLAHDEYHMSYKNKTSSNKNVLSWAFVIMSGMICGCMFEYAPGLLAVPIILGLGVSGIGYAAKQGEKAANKK